MASAPVTRPTSTPVADYVASLPTERRRAESAALIDLMRRATGHEPVMWGSSIIGFSAYHYRYDSGHEGDSALIGFSPRATRLSIYLADGFEGRDELLGRLGRHSIGRSCLYVRRLDDVDLGVLGELCAASVARMRATRDEIPVPDVR